MTPLAAMFSTLSVLPAGAAFVSVPAPPDVTYEMEPTVNAPASNVNVPDAAARSTLMEAPFGITFPDQFPRELHLPSPARPFHVPGTPPTSSEPVPVMRAQLLDV